MYTLALLLLLKELGSNKYIRLRLHFVNFGSIYTGAGQGGPFDTSFLVYVHTQT